jgi:hypothetical protein
MHTPRKLNTEIFGQINPGKTRKGEISERGFLLFLSSEDEFFYSRKNSAKIHKLISRFVPSNFLKNRAKTP